MKIKNFLRSMAFALTPLTLSAQTYTNVYPKSVSKAAHNWVKKGEWRKGFDKASPAPTVNETEFCIQYSRNAQQWDAVFNWLQTTDLIAIEPGRVPVGNSGLTASVEEGDNWCSEDDLQNGKGSESHRAKIDFMIVVKGTEGFARLDHETSKPNCDYTPDVLHYNFDKQKLERFESIPGTFNVMFPCDWHIAKVRTSKADQTVKVIVIKIDYAQ